MRQLPIDPTADVLASEYMRQLRIIGIRKAARQNILDLYQNREKRLRMAACARAAGKRDALDQIVHLVEQYCK